MNSRGEHDRPRQAALLPHWIDKGRARLVAVCLCAGLVWGKVLPALCNTEAFRERDRFLTSRGIDPSAMIYTELQRLPELNWEGTGRRHDPAQRGASDGGRDASRSRKRSPVNKTTPSGGLTDGVERTFPE